MSLSPTKIIPSKTCKKCGSHNWYVEYAKVEAGIKKQGREKGEQLYKIIPIPVDCVNCKEGGVSGLDSINENNYQTVLGTKQKLIGPESQ